MRCLLVTVGALVVLSAPAASAAPFATRPPVAVVRVPASVPSGGVVVGREVVLKRASPRPGEITAERAVSLTRRFVNHDMYPPETLLARLTNRSVPGMDDVRVWLLTFTSSKPLNVRVGCPPGHTCPPWLVRRATVVLDAATVAS